jgi:alpha-N-acetylglucosamine transferase
MLNHATPYSELTPKQFEVIGRSVVEWANLEFLLGNLLARLIGVPEFLSRTFTDSLSAARIQVAVSEAVEIQRIRYQAKLVAPHLLDDVDNINESISKLRAFRNKIAHFCWMRQSDDVIFGTSFSGGVWTAKKEKKATATIEVKELIKFNQDAYELVENIQKLLESIPPISEKALIAVRKDLQT